MILDLVPIGEAATPAQGGDNTIAEGLSLALHILLSFSHRKNYRRRVKPQPAIAALKRPNPPYDLLRPILTRLSHQHSLNSLQSLFGTLCATVASTGLSPTPSYTCITSNGASPSLTAAESVLTTLLDLLEITATLTITPSLSVMIKSRTFQYIDRTTIAGTVHQPFLISSSLTFPEYIKAPERLSSFEEVKEYVCWILACGVASIFAEVGEQDTSITAPGKAGWHTTSQPNVLRKTFEDKGKSKQLSFEIKEEGKLEMRWEWMSSDYRQNVSGPVPGEGVYVWTGKRIVSDYLEEVVRDLHDVVEEAGKWVVPQGGSADRRRRGSRISS